MIKFKHYVVIRFNLGLYRTNGRVPDQWFENRMEIFRTFTLPSLINQTVQDFTLVLLTDSEAPKKHRATINKVIASSGGDFSKVIVPIVLPDDWHPKRYGERWSSEIDYRAYLNPIRGQSKHVLQTRLDNDDAFLPNAIETMRYNCMHSGESYTLDFLKGYILDMVNHRAYYAKHPPGTPFISLYQRASKKMHSLYEWTHSKMLGKFPCTSRNDRIWIMHLHGKNVSNRLYPWMIEREIPFEQFKRETGLLK